jgi:dipeptidase E
MHRRYYYPLQNSKVKIVILLFAGIIMCPRIHAQQRTVFAYGGNFNRPFMEYIIKLTKKPNPRICYLATASGDNPVNILSWYKECEGLPMQPFTQKLFINSVNEIHSFEETLLSMDAIVVGGGNTLNMMAIWKAQGIDTVLKKAYDRGIILSGGSAGSVCWFLNGISDSRPKYLSIVQGLGFIPYSHCAHYHSQANRRPLYQDNILSGKMQVGYALDDSAAVLFINEKFDHSVSVGINNNAYFISVTAGRINEKLLLAEEIFADSKK